MSGRRRTNTSGLIIALVILAACVLFVLPALLSQNLLFAFGIITQKPAQAVVYHAGESYVFLPGSPEYDALTDAAYKTLSKEKGIVEAGWSTQRFSQARSEGTALELFYDEPVKVPGSRVDIADTYRLFFPLDVFGWDQDVVFRGGHSTYWGLPVRVDSFDRIRTVVDDIIAGQPVE